MIREWKAGKGYLKIPVETGAEKTRVRIFAKTGENGKDPGVLFDGMVPVSENRVDFWGMLPVDAAEGAVVCAETEEEGKWYDGIRWESGSGQTQEQRPVFHMTPPSGSFGRIMGLSLNGGVWDAAYAYDPFGTEKDREFAEKAKGGQDFVSLQKQTANRYIEGDIEEEYLSGEGTLCLAKSRKFQWEGVSCFNMLTPPLHLGRGENGEIVLFGGKEMEKFRIWKREWDDLTEMQDFRETLRFRIKPGIWPNIELLAPEGKQDDVTAKAFEIRLDLRPENGNAVQMDLCGFPAEYDGRCGTLRIGDDQIPVSRECLHLTVYADTGCAEFICGGKAVFRLRRFVRSEFLHVDNSVSGNLEKCRVEERDFPEIHIWSETSGFRIERLEVYGLERKEDTDPYLERFGICKDRDPVFYESSRFAVYDHYVRDENYGYPDAAVLTDEIVVSPVRTVEEFAWRNTPWGDMVRVADRDNVWCAKASLTPYPELHSPVTSLNAAYRIALDVFEQCKGKKFALSGQEGLWSSGLFQGPGEGFGVWLRDTAHVLLRCGSLVDPEGAKKTIRFAMEKGFDNASDGPAMGAAGLWDYHLATGDRDILYEMWPLLLENMAEADRRYEEEKGLAAAENSTSNDAFPEPENGGYSLSTECYFMRAYESMAWIADLIGYEKKEETEAWRARARKMRETIREEYWNPQYGYYTSGPKGTPSYRNGFWETSGEESVLWPKFGIASKEQRRSILEKLDSAAMTEYGIKLFPYRKEKNHFCGAVWGVWQAGIASAASAEGDMELIRRLLAQQIRVCLMNKTFYEVIDADTGIAWRWPGQLWNAAGFISLLFCGVFGIEYDAQGMYFHPAVTEKLADIFLKGLPYRKMILDIYVCGWGNRLREMRIDGRLAGFVPVSLEGRHEVVLYLS